MSINTADLLALGHRLVGIETSLNRCVIASGGWGGRGGRGGRGWGERLGLAALPVQDAQRSRLVGTVKGPVRRWGPVVGSLEVSASSRMGLGILRFRV